MFLEIDVSEDFDIDELSRRADADDIESQLRLGMYYAANAVKSVWIDVRALGKNHPVSRAVSYFEMAYRNGDSRGAIYQSILAIELSVDENYDDRARNALKVIESFAEPPYSHPEAMYQLSKIYANESSSLVIRDIIKPDYQRAEIMLENAAERGHVEAIYDLASLYMSGTETLPSDRKMSIELFSMAHDKGHPDAALRLAMIYHIGGAVFGNKPRDGVKAYMWARKAVTMVKSLESTKTARKMLDDTKRFLLNDRSLDRAAPKTPKGRTQLKPRILVHAQHDGIN